MSSTVRCHQRSLSARAIIKMDNGRFVTSETTPALRAEWFNAAPNTLGEAILEEVYV